jgi:hypothetical protein
MVICLVLSGRRIVNCQDWTASLLFRDRFAAGRSDQAQSDGGIIQIRPTNLSEDRELVFRRNVYIAPTRVMDRKSYVLKRGEVLFNNTNSQEQVGKSVYFDLEGNYFSSNHITRIRTVDACLNPLYLCYVLNLYQRRKVFFRLCTNGNNQSGVAGDVLKRIPIPLPRSKRQEEIVQRLEKIRTAAQELRSKAIEELAEAKQFIEALILGRERNETKKRFDGSRAAANISKATRAAIYLLRILISDQDLNVGTSTMKID